MKIYRLQRYQEFDLLSIQRDSFWIQLDYKFQLQDSSYFLKPNLSIRSFF